VNAALPGHTSLTKVFEKSNALSLLVVTLVSTNSW